MGRKKSPEYRNIKSKPITIIYWFGDGAWKHADGLYSESKAQLGPTCETKNSHQSSKLQRKQLGPKFENSSETWNDISYKQDTSRGDPS
jgi:hypothetical protein